MATSDSMKRAINKYNKEKTKNVTIRFMPADMDIYEYLKSQPNQAGLIKSLLRKHMEENK